MTLYLYEIGTSIPTLILDSVTAYTADQVETEDGTIYRPLADGFELSSLPDCSETLRADWNRNHPCAEQRIEELEALVAELLFGGDAV